MAAAAAQQHKAVSQAMSQKTHMLRGDKACAPEKTLAVTSYMDVAVSRALQSFNFWKNRAYGLQPRMAHCY